MRQPICLLVKTAIYFLMGLLVFLKLSYSISLAFQKYNSNSYFLSVIDKHKNYKERDTQNNLIIIGGSSNAFGVNSMILNKTLGVNAMNFGVHGDFGYQFYISEALHNIKENDIVLATIEYELTQSEKGLGNIELYQMFYESSGQGLIYSNFKHFLSYFFYGGKIIRDNIINYIDNPHPNNHIIYNRQAFDVNGDLQSQRTYNSTWTKCEGESSFNRKHFKPHPNYIRSLEKLHTSCKIKNAMLLISFPPVAKSAFNEKRATQLLSMLESSGLNVINLPENTVYCDTLFVGTDYHLTKYGRTINSKRLSLDISKFLSNLK